MNWNKEHPLIKCLLGVLVFLIFYTEHANAQVIRKGKLLERETGAPIAYGSLYFVKAKKGILSDEQGLFSIQMESVSLNDTLIIHSLGHKTVYKPLRELQYDDIIFLERAIYPLPEVVVKATDDVLIRKGALKHVKGSHRNCLKKNLVIALFIEGGSNEKLKSVAFYVTKKGWPETPFRVRVFDVDSLYNQPGKDILTKSIIVEGAKGARWAVTDISDFNIQIPKNGCFVAMEWLHVEGSHKYLIGNSPDSQKMCFGQSLGMTHEFDKNKTWISINGGYTWIRFEEKFGKRKFSNAAIGVEVIKRG